MSISLALTFGIMYWLSQCKLWYGILHLLRQPMVLAVPIGLIMGDLPNAMIMGASLQMIYLGAIAPGGTLPSDEGWRHVSQFLWDCRQDFHRKLQ